MKLRRAGKSFPRQLTTGTESSVFCLVMYRELSGHYHGGQRGEQELRNQVRGQSLNLILSYFHFYCMTICYVPKCRWSLAMVKCTWVAVVEIKEKWVTVTCERQRRKRWIASKVKYQGICRLAQDSLEVEWGERKKKTWNEKKSDTLGLFPIFNIVFFHFYFFLFCFNPCTEVHLGRVCGLAPGCLPSSTTFFQLCFPFIIHILGAVIFKAHIWPYHFTSKYFHTRLSKYFSVQKLWCHYHTRKINDILLTLWKIMAHSNFSSSLHKTPFGIRIQIKITHCI